MQSFLNNITEAMVWGIRGHSRLENRILYLTKKPLCLPAKKLPLTQFLLVILKIKSQC